MREGNIHYIIAVSFFIYYFKNRVNGYHAIINAIASKGAFTP
jgi:hypothetical protein